MRLEPRRLPPLERLREAIAGRRDWAVRSLRELVARPTVLGQEDAGQEVVASLYEELGCEVREVPIRLDELRDRPGFSPPDWPSEGKRNLVGLHEPEGAGGRSLVLNGHIDVVSPEPFSLWSGPPFEARLLRDGPDGETWIQGRGAGDMKGGTVGYLWALAALRDLGLVPDARVVLQSPVEEECSGLGTLALLAAGYGQDADACIIPEPFDRTVLRRQVGVLWFRVRVLGRTTHVLGAGRGVNAIERSWPLIEALRDLETELNRPEAVPEGYRGVEHPLNLNVGVIRGGDWASTVAGECVTWFRLGLWPGRDPEEALAQVRTRVAEAAAADDWLRDSPPRVEQVGFRARGCECSLDGDFGRALARAHAGLGGAEPTELRATCTTDVRFFELDHGVPATCYGPRAVDIHGVDERVSLDSMQEVASVLAAFIQDWCGLRPSPSRPGHGGETGEGRRSG